MTDNINIGNIQAGVVIAGGTGHTVHSGTANARAAQDARVDELRGLLGHLVQLAEQRDLSPRMGLVMRTAGIEGAKATLDLSYLRVLMRAVQADFGTASPVGQASVNVVNAISAIERASPP